MHKFFRQGALEVWIRYGTGESKRYISIHITSTLFEEIKPKALLKALLLTGCDITSKLGSK